MGETRLCVSHYPVDRPGRILEVRVKVSMTSWGLRSKLPQVCFCHILLAQGCQKDSTRSKGIWYPYLDMESQKVSVYQKWLKIIEHLFSAKYFYGYIHVLYLEDSYDLSEVAQVCDSDLSEPKYCAFPTTLYCLSIKDWDWQYITVNLFNITF